MFSLTGQKVFVAGHRGMVGSALVRRLATENCQVLTASRAELDLVDQVATQRWMDHNHPDVVIIAAAKVGGILANDTKPAEFLYQNLMIEANLIHAAHRSDVAKLLFLGSSCIYPKFADQPIKEESLLTGSLEPTNEWYAIAKIAGIKLTQAYRLQNSRDFISGMPTNLYGPNDNFDLQTSHVMPALVRKVVEAQAQGRSSIEIWGSGNARREFLHVDDCADACVHLLKNYSETGHINIGAGQDIAIIELAQMIIKEAGADLEIVRDESKPDGTPRKLLSTDRMQTLGWTPSIPLRAGIRQMIEICRTQGFDR